MYHSFDDVQVGALASWDHFWSDFRVTSVRQEVFTEQQDPILQILTPLVALDLFIEICKRHFCPLSSFSMLPTSVTYNNFCNHPDSSTQLLPWSYSTYCWASRPWWVLGSAPRRSAQKVSPWKAQLSRHPCWLCLRLALVEVSSALGRDVLYDKLVTEKRDSTLDGDVLYIYDKPVSDRRASALDGDVLYDKPCFTDGSGGCV